MTDSIRVLLDRAGAARCGPRARAQTYPDAPIRMIVGFTPGSATDITARMFAQKLGEAWNVPVTVENMPGAGGSVGGERVGEVARPTATRCIGARTAR